jgi:large subunit ribosomal protein L13
MKHTQSTKPQKEKVIERAWHLIDAKGQIVGRVATNVASLLQGKHKPMYSTHLDNGDNVIVINAKATRMTGRKLDQKVYTRYSGYPGGLKSITAGDLMKKKPSQVMKNAVWGMLPKNKLRDDRIIRLHVFDGPEHPFADKLAVEATS